MPVIWKPLLLALRKRLKENEIMIGVDEDTAIIGKLNGAWKAMGKSKVHVFTKSEEKTYSNGEDFNL
jgi:cyanophycinase-like exopeptidase